jgi:carboxymethylenebutenolidase
MQHESVEIETPDGVANAYLSRPDGDPRPGVLLIPDAFGLRPAIETMADRVASGGYVVLAPNVFYRARRAPVEELAGPVDGENRANAFQKVLPLIRELTPERVAADGGAYLGYLERVAAPGPLGVTGYCMGGRIAWRIATTHPDRVAALAAFHTAGLVGDDPGSTHLSAADLGQVEAYFGFADEDPGATPEQIATLRQALDAAGVRYTAEVYQGAHHGYAVPDAPAFDEAASERQFRELQALLRRAVG